MNYKKYLGKPIKLRGKVDKKALSNINKLFEKDYPLIPKELRENLVLRGVSIIMDSQLTEKQKLELYFVTFIRQISKYWDIS